MTDEFIDRTDRDIEQRVGRAYDAAASALPEQLLSNIRANAAPQSAKSISAIRPRLWLMPALALTLALVIGGTLWLPQTPDYNSQRMSLPEALVAEFATFVASGRAFDVDSSDAQALSTWFRSRLDTPQPPDPPIAATLRLAGGRLCQIQRNRVPSYVYRHGDTLVSLYITRAPAQHRPKQQPQSVAVDSAPHWDGPQLIISRQKDFAYATWQQGVWRYSLVAELPTQAIAEIATQLSTQLLEQRS